MVTFAVISQKPIPIPISIPLFGSLWLDRGEGVREAREVKAGCNLREANEAKESEKPM